MKNRFLSILAIALLLFSCNDSPTDEMVGLGVPHSLAQWRKSHILHPVYNLFFDIPSARNDTVRGRVDIGFVLAKQQSVILDFVNSPQSIHSLEVNGQPVDYQFEDEHVVIPRKAVDQGENIVSILFDVNELSLNRREEFLYTLLVPDRARTLFPCFDQPDMKAVYNLSLEIPDTWSAVGNSVESYSPATLGRRTVRFAPTEPLSTYLFAFVAGEFQQASEERNGRRIRIFHRETDPQHTNQMDDIFDLVFGSLEWLEDYTAIAYPFAKYDLVILPGFQYGGMEHTGATLYADRKMFLTPYATSIEQMARCKLIAHETAHMWFGDLVTMKWFDDVWTKEVMANYFASLMATPAFAGIDHQTDFVTDYFPAAYDEERTSGTNPIHQQLDNLNNAGLLYGNIIYDKSPIVMQMLVDLLTPEKFQQGVRLYLKRYAYDNATWNDLIAILDSLSSTDLTSWSAAWVDGAGMPQIEWSIEGQNVVFRQSNTTGAAVGGQRLRCAAFDDKGSRLDFDTYLDGAQCSIELPIEAEYIIPNFDGRAYGCCITDSITTSACFALMLSGGNNIERAATYINLYENLLRGNIRPDNFVELLTLHLPKEQNSRIYSLGVDYAAECNRRYYHGHNDAIEDLMWSLFDDNPASERGLTALRAVATMVSTREGIERLESVWRDYAALSKAGIAERDAMNFSYELAIRIPWRADEITASQLSRIENADRQREYRFVSRAVSPLRQTRDSLFEELLSVQGREVEPWASKALQLLNHQWYGDLNDGYLLPGLEAVEEVQRTGDIFFPRAWARALLRGHNSDATARIVDEFFATHADYNPLLRGKILQQADHLNLKTE